AGANDGSAATATTAPPGMVLIPAGPFWMGLDKLPPDTPWGQEDAKPRRRVILPSFYIDRHEVTYGDYQKYDPKLEIPGRTAPFPVTDVNWFEADSYCRSIGKRLPTEAEWEKAARGADGRVYPWGNAFDPKKTNVGSSPAPVGRHPEDRSPYGVMDMAGNVSEWTESWYQPYPGNTYRSTDYGIVQKVVRGGSFNGARHFADEMFSQTTFRNYNRPDAFGPDTGFRCARSAPKEAGR
ncbi:MAG TPA: SUMF1/EgtB/PvdO family nonheme iron enzyme, partial [Candidatus Manganitrophaceae bacterium]|nr:SUMF1/EgtB/PvdO family nonheme iron enzyme [Candidatus Manganitrophaceae bacterium]